MRLVLFFFAFRFRCGRRFCSLLGAFRLSRRSRAFPRSRGGRNKGTSGVQHGRLHANPLPHTAPCTGLRSSLGSSCTNIGDTGKVIA
ncbi:hypothetical protein PF005_g12764 [Phytophthora fragariae]|uniref:Secreted protein n=2 Tax=Phytophthora TaxID=4783 RepID=A0A6A4D0W8_9STRA|nr:hypothetical protein PF003_g39412 [Phytophthora fragariae]KAE9036746.1 hypothetical protein PR002_g6914 [Phytophthora rubi]KAE8930621.1 hypothetical protein PF009_g19295 [Phytophthora fragariae]KAE8993535.1 hypothetical protein PF011_g17104 [Phytophthora fragariae]KAE9092852.1 hypothetical protein PF007_g18332 [Phytophthora fragariae]